MKILAVMSDIFFFAKIGDAAKRVGLTVEMIQDSAAAVEKSGAGQLAILDLNYAKADPIVLIGALKARGVRVIAFVSHVQTDARRAALDAGCDEVFARSAFSQNLDAILRQQSTE